MSLPPEPPPLQSIESADALYTRVLNRGRRLRRERRAFIATAGMSFLLLAAAVPVALTNDDNSQVATTDRPTSTTSRPTTTTSEPTDTTVAETTTSLGPIPVEDSVTTPPAAPRPIARATPTTARRQPTTTKAPAPPFTTAPPATTTTTPVPASRAASACAPSTSVAVNRTQIAFVRAGDIWITGPDAPINLTNTPSETDSNPAWSPDGTTIVYASPNGLALVTPGAEPTPLTLVPGDTEPAWSPDRSTIAFVRAGNIATVAASGGQVRVVADDPDPFANPTWSPDSCKLAFTWRGGIVRSQFDGSGIRHVAAGFIQPDWGSGNRIAASCVIGGRREVSLINPNDGSSVRLTLGGAEQPSWNGDGNAVAFAAPNRANPGIYTQAENGGGLALVPGTGDGDTSPAW